jgi:cytoskeletal protein CcmA (bactofilin family)
MTIAFDTGDTPRQTIVDEGSVFHGTFKSSRPIVVHGSIRGAVTAPEVTIAPLGAIVGVIKADKLTSSGTLSGTVDAVHVLLSGRVRRDTVVKAEQLDMSLHAERGLMEVTFGPPLRGALALSSKSVIPTSDLASPSEAPEESKSEARTRRSRNKQRRV